MGFVFALYLVVFENCRPLVSFVLQLAYENTMFIDSFSFILLAEFGE